MRSVVFLLLSLFLAGCAAVERSPALFQVGDVAIARNFSQHPELNGSPVKVTGEYQWRWIKGGNTLRCYAITTVDGQELAAQTFQLQRIAVNGRTP